MPIGVAILGFAHGHVNSYCQRWKTNPEMGVKVVAGFDRDGSRLMDSAKKLGIDAIGDLPALLRRDDVQAVVIAAETSEHASLVEAAARAGKAIVLQKPMAMTMPEADRIVAAVEKSGVPFSMAWQMRVDPQNLKMKELLDSGAIGRPFMARRRHGLTTQNMGKFEESWHASPVYNRDIWADDASHAIDFILWLLGKPESVTAEIDSLLNPRVPMDNGVAVYRYPGGPLAVVHCSFVCHAAENTTEIFGDKGSVIQNFGDNPSCNNRPDKAAPALKWYSAESKQWTMSDLPTPAGHSERIAHLAGPLADFLNGRRGPIATAEEGRTALRMTLACYVSTREGRRVALDDPQIDTV